MGLGGLMSLGFFLPPLDIGLMSLFFLVFVYAFDVFDCLSLRLLITYLSGICCN